MKGTLSFVLYARHKSEWRITPVAVAVYDGESGALIGKRFDTLDEAIRRGDAADWAKTFDLSGYEANVPLTLDAMNRIMESTGNAMSALRWASCSVSIKTAVEVAGSGEQYVNGAFYDVVRPDLDPGSAPTVMSGR